MQVRDTSGLVHVFRVAGSLLTKGPLKDLLEDPSTVKVVHGCCQMGTVLHSHGVVLWNVFDTSWAQAVIDYQTTGRKLSKGVGLSSLCKRYGLKANPLQEAFATGDHLDMDFMDQSEEDIPEDFLHYLAHSVDSLIDLYLVMRDLLAPDFCHLLEKLCTCDLLKSVDPKSSAVLKAGIFLCIYKTY